MSDDILDRAESVVVLYKEIVTRYDPDDEIPEQATVKQRGTNLTIAFEEGEELPMDLARRCWDAFSDRLAAFDAEGNRLDTPSSNEHRQFDTSLLSHR